MLKVFVNPTYVGGDRKDGGIRRVSDAQVKFLPEYDIGCVYSPDEADLIANHGTAFAIRPGVPSVSHCHGLYWLGYDWPLWSETANADVTRSLLYADAVTAPTKWVANAIQRGSLRPAIPIYHGIDPDEWSPPEEPLPYILWNKARRDPVSNPEDMQKLAGMTSNLPYITTFGEPTPNVKVIGAVKYPVMKEITRKARVYLATARETFGIGTLEALACGIPVVGWDYGGQREIIKQGETGILVPYGDYQALAEAVQDIWNTRERYSSNCRQDVLDRWLWKDKIEQYALLYWKVYQDFHKPRPKVSIIVTTYNLSKYLDECLNSVKEVAFSNYECLVIDDCSTDDTQKVVRKWLDDPRFSYSRTPENLGLSGARNFGAEQSTGEYLIFLDADDLLDRNALQDFVDALDNDRGKDIVYGGLETISDDGSNRRRNPWPKGVFRWEGQISHLNQLPYASMMRRSVFDMTGGYRIRDWRAEDAAFWLRATSFGFKAERVTDRPSILYRIRSDSKSSQERESFSDTDGDWTAWFPWRLGASSGPEGEKLLKSGAKPDPILVPFASQGQPPHPHAFWPVHHHEDPLISVIIPVGPGHERYVIDALDSLVAQTFSDWEALVIDDTGTNLDIKGHPYTRIIHTKPPMSGAGRARNIGIQESKGKLLFFLDADDWIRPDTLKRMAEEYSREGGYIYSDCVALLDNSESKRYTQYAGRGDWNFTHTIDTLSENQVLQIQAVPYNRQDFLRRGYEDNMPGAHSVSILVAKEDIESIGGFDEKVPFWEDWIVMLELARIGVCGHYIEEPLISYRITTGKRRKSSREVEDGIRQTLRSRYEKIAQEVDPMCGCGKGGKSLQSLTQARLSPYQLSSQSTQVTPVSDSPGVDASKGFREGDKVRLRYVGPHFGAIPFKGRVTGITYLGGRDPINEIILVEVPDVPFFLQTRQFVEVDSPQERKAEVVQW